MGKDWGIWVLCILLFCTGAIWAQVPLDLEFFKIKSIHDLFEIFSSIATVVAVFLAYKGLHAWRQQVKGNSDHELAARVLVAARRYKDALSTAWMDARFSISQVELGENSLSPKVFENLRERMAAQLKVREELKAIFLAELLEVRALWGDEYVRSYDALINFGETCNECVRAFVGWVGADTDNLVKALSKYQIERCKEKFQGNNWWLAEGKIGSSVEAIAKDGDELIGGRLISS